MPPLDTAAPRPELADLTLSNATIVLPDRVVTGGLRIEGGRIAGLTRTPGIDMEGDVLMPGIVDIHTDHVEKHVFPRSSVQWNMIDAFVAHDAQVIGSGITTVFDSLSIGATMRRPERRSIPPALVAALVEARTLGLLRADHLLHLRCEITDPETVPLVEALLPEAQVVSIMDHTPGDRQCTDVGDWIRSMARDLQITLEDSTRLTGELIARSEAEGPAIRARVVALAAAAGLPMLSHDDASPAHVAQAAAEGVAVSEFPTTLAAARAARAAGLGIVAGAPNYLRGGSQSGNVAVRDLLAEGLVDILASDYVPRSLVEACFGIAEDPTLPQTLAETIAMVTAAPAAAAGLHDRGSIAEGQRADLLRIRRVSGSDRAHSLIRGMWRGGRKVN